MRMRAGVLWSAVALALLAVTSALRTSQVEGVTRTSRRLAVDPSASDANTVTSTGQETSQPTLRLRGAKRHEETSPQRDIVRTRTRTRVEIPPTAQAQPQSSPKNERFDSRRTRTRSQPAKVESTKDASITRDTVIRSRSRGNSRISSLTNTTPVSVELTSPSIDESKLEIINSNLDDITKLSKEPPTPATQSRRKNIAPTIESVAPQRSRGRINTRPNARSLDLTVSGTTNTLSIAEKTPTTARTAADLRNSRKLRYRTRPSETDTNLTGEGLVSANEVIKSSQNSEIRPSQQEKQNDAPVLVETIIQQSTETNKPKTTTIKVTKVLKRPLTGRRIVKFRPSVSLPSVSKESDEISEDDNYPASFKALIQAKNASTQVRSPASESLSLKGSQKVYKTYSTSSQSTLTGPGTNKYSRLRNKQTAEETKTDSKEESRTVETTEVPEVSKPQISEYRPRGTYAPRNRKSTFTSSLSSTQSTSSSERSSEKPVFKYSRKFKASTTVSPKLEPIGSKSVESNNTLKKPFVRPRPFYSRKLKDENEPKNVSSTETLLSENKITKTSIKTVRRPTLPRTSFYTKTRNINNKNEIPPTMDTLKKDATEVLIKKSEDLVETPLVFALLNNSEAVRIDTQPENKDNHMFLITVTSKESLENSTINEVTNTAEESENMPIVNTSPTISTKQDADKYKYHSNYKDANSTNNNDKEKSSSTVLPLVRNLQTRKYGRNRAKTNEEVVVTSPKTLRTIRKFSESFSKTTEASNNGITPEPEKTKSRFSSKYRASYLDKPFYKPTVPTITPSTAWLKFYVTDHLLTKSVEEPNWFQGDIYTTESMSRLYTTPYIHESSIEPVEGEEIQLGPDLNAISFTQTRRTLDSADLRLSESLVKPSHVMNVEASHHSPSVTISIFDALAEILTSTPRPRLSSTTEMTKVKSLNTDIKQVLNGVSNNTNVNNVKGLVSQETIISKNVDVSTTTKPVQPTVQTPNVINSILVGATATLSLNTEDENSTPVNTLQSPAPTPTPIPTPTTPVSARRPFAIRILYSDTESATDKFTTASQPTQGSTDSSKMVYNSVSDLLLSNNNLVSSELTSMLSNNIKSVIENMDESSRSRLNAVDMNRILRTLIPRALDRVATALDNADSIPNTTPYSLDDIKDTENIVIDDIESNNVVQNVATNSSVNITVENKNVSTKVTQIPADVNSPVTTGITASISSVSNGQVTAAATTISTLATSERPSSEAISTTASFDTATSPASLDTDSIQVVTINEESSSDSTNKIVPLPFLTNFHSADFTDSDVIENTQSTIANPLTVSNTQVSLNGELQDPTKISPLQLWVLSKKAQVLKMIEDLIRQHNTELATAPPLTDFVRSDNVNLSERLTNIVNTMISSTSTETVTTPDVESTSPMTTESSVINPFSTIAIQTTTNANPERGLTTNPSTTTGTVINNDITTTTKTLTSIPTSYLDPFENNSSSTTLSSGTTVTSTASNDISTLTSVPTTDAVVEVLSRLQDGTATTTPVISAETTTTPTAATTAETTTQVTTETTTINIDITTTEASDSNTIPTTINTFNIGSRIIPKKDYVIFGILPNNTVVRKDPNQDILETLTEASPYIVYGVLPNNTVIRKFPNGTRVPRVMQKIDILPISPWSLRNPYSPIHNNPAIVRPQSNPIRVSTNTVTFTDTSNNGTERLTNDTVNNQQTMISTSALNIKSSNGITTTNMPEKSTASHVLSLRTTSMLPSIDEILLNSISSAAKQDMVISEMTSSTREPRILTLDIDPETQQIRTEKPEEGDRSAVFKFIPIDEIMVQPPQDSNVLKLSSTKTPSTNSAQSGVQTATPTTVTEMNTLTPQIQTQETITEVTTSQITTSIVPETTVPSSAFTNTPATTVAIVTPETTILTSTTTTTSEPITTTTTTSTTTTTTPAPTTTTTSTPAATTTTPVPTTTTTQSTTTTQTSTTTLPLSTLSIEEELKRYQEDVQLLKTLLQATGRDPKSLNLNPNLFSFGDITTTIIPKTTTQPTTTTLPSTTTQRNDAAKLLQALITNLNNPTTLSVPNFAGNTKQQITTTARSIEDDIKQFEEDTKLLQALLQATGQNPATLNIPSLDSLTTSRTLATGTQTVPTTTAKPVTITTARPTIVTTTRPTTTVGPTTTQSIEDDLRQYQEDTKLLQALLQATGQNPANLNIPIVSGVTSNVRIASNPQTTSLWSNPTTPLNIRPVYTTTNGPIFKTFAPRTIVPTLQPTTENVKISTTFQPFNQRRQPITTTRSAPTTLTGRRAPGFTSTTEMPSTSTFSVEEDLAFLNNLKSVLNTNPKNADPEAALANRIIALAVEKSLNEIQTGKPDATRTGKNIAVSANNLISETTNKPITTSRPTTTTRLTTTTTTSTTTTQRPTTTQRITTTVNSPSIDDDIRQFQEDTKLLQALLQATGQDPSKLNLPTLPPNINVSQKLPNTVNEDLKLLSNLLASPSPLNEPFDPLTPKPLIKSNNENVKSGFTATALPYGAKIAVKDNLKNVQDDKKLLQTLIKLQDVQETTTQKSKLTITGQSADEALKNLVRQQKPSGMVSEATRAPISLSTEFGKSNDALLAALLKEQGFGPTTASSLDEQLRLSALLNQVVVTPKARRTTTPPPPPPAPRRPILDGLAWLWQQWRDTAPGSGSPRPNRGPPSAPAPSARPSMSSTATSTRASWLGSGPFVGNADDRPANRIPLEPPRSVASEQTPGRGQLVSAAINVTRAFSQFLGAAIQGAAQTVQSVIRAGQRAATDVYVNGSGSG